MQCRFCLEDETAPNNSLIEPCICSGSIRYVHIECLRRWARMNPDANSTICNICNTPYSIEVLPDKETIPDGKTVSVWILEHTVVSGAIFQYIIVVIRFTSDTDIFTFNLRLSQLLFQFIFLICFMINYSVKNEPMYAERIHTGQMSYIFLVYLATLSRIAFFNETSFCFIINIVSNLFWREHTRILADINQTLDYF